MAGEVLYRKYRSKGFDDVVGQDAIIRSLTGALRSGRISHAYLFTGPRGVGKTSVARLLARAISCEGEALLCGTCGRCTDKSPIDIIEIDAASHNGVDDIRSLREKVHAAPAAAKYKVYIIDEVHMLSSGAWGALLKTLEEPPAHAVFILATTETHKVPETIVSRTQRYAFKPIPTAVMVPHLEKIAAAEGMTLAPDAALLIAGLARGGFRDGISLLDQLASSGDGAITAELVREILGLGATEQIQAIGEAMAQSSPAATLAALDTAVRNGTAPTQILAQLIEYWRVCLRAAAGMKDPEATPTHLASAQAAGAACSARILDELIAASKSPWPLLSLEAAIVRLGSSEPASTPRPAAPRRSASREKTDDTPPDPQPATSRASQSKPSGEPAPVTRELWPKVLGVVKRTNNSLYALLQMYPVDFSEDSVTIRTKFNFHRDLFLKPVNRAAVETALQRVYGRHVGFHAVTDAAQAKAQASSAKPSEELAAAALEILGGEVVD